VANYSETNFICFTELHQKDLNHEQDISDKAEIDFQNVEIKLDLDNLKNEKEESESEEIEEWITPDLDDEDNDEELGTLPAMGSRGVNFNWKSNAEDEVNGSDDFFGCDNDGNADSDSGQCNVN